MTVQLRSDNIGLKIFFILDGSGSPYHTHLAHKKKEKHFFDGRRKTKSMKYYIINLMLPN